MGIVSIPVRSKLEIAPYEMAVFQHFPELKD